MPPLSAKKRAGLPNSAFAYIDAHGRRRLPINDEAHVRNALARFNQVTFEDDAARQRARRRLLNAAKKHGILPIGFITGQLRSERKHASAAPLPKGFVTLLMTDIENSTGAVVGRSAPTGVRFNSLGRHRLPGIPKAEALFQVEANGLRSRFPPPRTTAAPQPEP